MTDSRYHVVYKNRQQPRDISTRPRLGSFVEFTKIDDSRSKMSSDVYVFKALEEAAEGNGSDGCVRKFVAHDHPTKGGDKENVNTNPISKIKAIAVKKYKKPLKIEVIHRSTNIHRKIRGFSECKSSSKTQLQFYEYTEGCTLYQYKFKDEAETLEVFASLIESLQKIHETGYVHLDLHPKNIIVTGALRVFSNFPMS